MTELFEIKNNEVFFNRSLFFNQPGWRSISSTIDILDKQPRVLDSDGVYRKKEQSLEAAVKYLIINGLAKIDQVSK